MSRSIKRFAFFVCLLPLTGFALVSFLVPPVFACMPLDDSMATCDRSVLIRPKIVVAATKPPVAVAAALPSPKRGTSPADAMEPLDTWQTIAAGTGLWFSIGEDSLNRVHLDVWLDAHGQGGIGFAVYSPDQMGQISEGVVPKGRGTVNRNDRTHDLTWTGQAPAGGTWYVLVTNSNPIAVPYKLGYNRVVTGPRQGCSGPYEEFLGGGVGHEVIWPGYCP